MHIYLFIYLLACLPVLSPLAKCIWLIEIDFLVTQKANTWTPKDFHGNQFQFSSSEKCANSIA